MTGQVERKIRAPRRVVTGHDESGRSIVIEDRDAPNVTLRTETGGIVSTLLWVTDQSPASTSGRHDAADRKMGVPPPKMGSAFRVIEFPPTDPAMHHKPNVEILRDWGMEGEALPGHPPRHPLVHRTRTIDYIVVLEGEIDMMLDEGEVHLRAGDTLIQRGTNHGWINRGTAPCRVAIIFIDADEPDEVRRAAQ
ncbi:cupin domain-containing protein [Pararobbsia silviterrae]|nr:cupin domain-containing protein [Pararobbsia silviterrae]